MDSSMQLIPYFMVFLPGLLIGSFLNVVIHRMPREESIVFPPSHCPSCRKRLGFIELIPLLGYLFLRGRCRACGAGINLRYPLVELATGLLFVSVYHHFGITPEGVAYLFLLCILLAVFFTDLEHRRVPNILVVVCLGVGLLWQLLQLVSLWISTQIFPAMPVIPAPPLSLGQALLGLALGGGVMLLIMILSRGGMGAGDVKLMALLGFYVGVPGTLLVFFLSFLAGGLVGVVLLLFKLKRRKDALPFAPFIVVAALIEIFWGNELWQWYLQFTLGR